jgi:HEAT repeat protein
MLATCVLLVLAAGSLVTVRPARAQQAAAPAAPDLPALVTRLSALDYATRTGAARLIRRAPAAEAVPGLTQAVRTSTDEFVRYRALVLLTGFGDRGTPALMRELIADHNDRVREVAYRWFQLYPDPSLTTQLLTSLRTEQAEFVRPALIRALAAVSADAAVQRELTSEAGRGLDFFRSAVIETLGLAKARWAVAAILETAKIDGPLQDDAVLALGRIGDLQALPVLAAIPARPIEPAIAVQAALCLLGDDCAARIAWLKDSITSRLASPEVVRAGVAALSALALTSDPAMTELAALLGNPAVRDSAAIGLGGVALRDPARVLAWLDRTPAAERELPVAALDEAFERFEEDFAEEQFYAATRAAYWSAPEGAPARTLMAALIDTLDF